MPGRRGVLTLVAAAALIAAGRAFGIDELFVLGVSLGGLAVLSLVWMYLSPTRSVPTVERNLEPEIATPGTEVAVVLKVTNGASATSATLVMNEHQPSGRTRRIWLAPLTPGESAVGSYRLAVRGRGVFAVGPLALSRVDPLHLWRRRIGVGPIGDLVVGPATTHLDAWERSDAAGLIVPRPTRTGEDDIRGVRDFREGDEVRNVHWRTSARRGSLVVLERDAEGTPSITVRVDNDAAHHSGRSFELALEIAGSTLLASARAGQRCVLALGSEPAIESQGPNAAATLLRALAGAQIRGEPRRDDRRSRDDSEEYAGNAPSGAERFADGVAIVGPLHPPVDHLAALVLVAAPPEAGDVPWLNDRPGRIRAISSLDDLRDQWQDLRTGAVRR